MEKTIDVTSAPDQVLSVHPAMSWRSVVAGTLISLFVFIILLSLGIAIGGVSLSDGAQMQRAGTMGGIWFILSVVISLAVGGYLASRVSKFASPWVGVAQASVIATLFSFFILYQVLGMAGWLAQSAGSFIGSAAQMGGQAAQGSGISNTISNMLEDRLGDVQFKGDAKTVVTGVGQRLIQGDRDGAKSYLARNSNLSEAQIESRMAQLNTQVDQAKQDAQQAAATTLKVTGWSLFAFLVLCWIGAVLGGFFGAMVNQRQPITVFERTHRRAHRPAYT